MKKIINICVGFLCFFASCFLIINISGLLYAMVTKKIDINSANSFYLYDKDNNLIFSGNKNDDWVSIDEISPYVIYATLSVEDKNFYKHNGFDYLRIGKALFEDLKSFKIVQGASTITQQYAKNLFLDFDKSWKRKWKEMWITYDLEYHYSKDEILEGYLNTINYGNGVYGIANAAKYYFNKNVKDLNLSEASILAGIPNSPANFSPIDNYDNAKERQLVVLTRMNNNRYISDEEKDYAYNKKLNIYGKFDDYNLSTLLYYQDAVVDELLSINKIPKSYIETGGIKIYTSLDLNAQTIIEEETINNIVNNDVQSTKVMMNPNDGSVIALSGGINYNKSQYNRALYSLRQPGSSIKPFLYYGALENGFTSSTTFLSEATTFNFDKKQSYKVKNSGNIYGNKEISLAAAIAYSDNIYAVKTNLFLGENVLYNILKKVGFTSNIEATPSLALGTYEVSALELAKAYSSLANSGYSVKPHFINKVTDKNGNVLYEFKEEKEAILDSSITFIISELLTGTYDSNLIDYTYPTCINMLSTLTNKYAIKSGSTNTDAWVVGYNKDVVLVSWSGYDDSREISTDIVSSNKVMWQNIIEKYFKNKKTSWYSIPDNVVGVLVDPISGKVATNDSKNKKILYYISGTEPDYN